jgi:hypothetical protein
VVVRTPFGPVNVGDAANGLCGGMVFAALDAWTAGQALPTVQPSQGDPWFSYLVRRLVDSWDVPAGVLRYASWMLRSDVDVAHRTLIREWPAIRTALDAGRSVPLGVVTVASRRPGDLSLNHQVLACAYQGGTDGDPVVLEVYDPNRGQVDGVTVTFRTDAVPLSGPAFAHTLGISRPVRGFFAVGWTAATPPPSP